MWKCGYSGQWRVFTGNEVGGLLYWWLWQQYTQSDKQNTDIGKVHFTNQNIEITSVTFGLKGCMSHFVK